ncbi:MULTISPECIES: glycosyltransferase family 4 protein [Bacteroides]|mgnify:FL=1|jgi:spore coat protein SA|uniref:glycosyltransferase family 4 protein n=1 Tax=Bacteroides TaxID=816 RepID=UPI001D997544|nr:MULTISPECIES: glycosyltransferase family 4 protein [Bacteroides]MBS6965203.1 glycosyltransferase family 4 protein [Bacteroides sp.]MDC1831578.1 glycosyltransferase family 4 protein [Bacteroides uniformis]
MRKIAIILPGDKLPLPSVKGGAVESLVQCLLDYNEKYHTYNFVVFSVYNEEAALKSRSYKHTDFKYINTDSLNYKLKQVFRWIYNRFFPYIGNQFINSVMNGMDTDYDYVLIENAPWFVIPLKRKMNMSMVQHLHNNYLGITSSFNQQIIDNSDFVLAVSKFIKNEILSHLNCTPELISVLYNGISLERFGKSECLWSLREQLGISHDDFVFVFSGRLVPEKGIKELLLAIKQIQHLNFKLLIIGSSFFSSDRKTSFIEELQNLSSELPNVIFTGYIPYQKIQDYYHLANVAIVPSIGDEACPLSCIEFMASSLPLIVTDSGGMVELVDEDCAIIIKRNENIITQLKDAMINLLNNKRKCQLMGEAARKRSTLFSDLVYSKKFIDLIDN